VSRRVTTMHRVGVTGASGFLGLVLLPQLIASGKRTVVALTRTLPPTPFTHDVRIQWIQGDLRSFHDCADFVSGLDAVIHLAPVNRPLTSNAELVGDASLNIVPTVTLLEAIRDEGRRPHLIYVSTGGALYRVTEGVPSSEDSDVEPATSYGIQKLM